MLGRTKTIEKFPDNFETLYDTFSGSFAVRQLGTKRTFSEGSDFFFEMANGNIPGLTQGTVAGNNPGLSADTEESVNNIRLETGTGAVYTYLTTDTTVYISSSNANDTQIIALVGFDDTFTAVVRIATLNGQTPVAFSGDIFRVTAIAIISSPQVAAVGNIYLSTDNTDITAGVPNTLSKVLAKIDTGGTQGTLANRTISATQKAYLFNIVFNSSKSTDADIILRFRTAPDDDFAPAPPFQVFQNTDTVNQIIGTPLPAKTDIDITAISPTAGSKITAQFSLILTDI